MSFSDRKLNNQVAHRQNEFTEGGQEFVKFTSGVGVGLGCGVTDSIKETALIIFDSLAILALKHKQFWQGATPPPALIKKSQERMQGRLENVIQIGKALNDLLVYNEILSSERNNYPLSPSIEARKDEVKLRVKQWAANWQALPLFKKGEVIGMIIGGLKAHKIVPKTLGTADNLIHYGKFKRPPRFRLTESGDPKLGYISSLTVDQIRSLPGEQKYIFVKYRLGGQHYFKINHEGRPGHPQLTMLPTGETPLVELAGEAFFNDGSLKSIFGSLNNGSGRAMTFGEHIPSQTVRAFRKFGFKEAGPELFENFTPPIPLNPKKGFIPGLSFNEINNKPGIYNYVFYGNEGNYTLKIQRKFVKCGLKKQEVNLRELAVNEEGLIPKETIVAGELEVGSNNTIISRTNMIQPNKLHHEYPDLNDPLAKALKKLGFKDEVVFLTPAKTTISPRQFRGNTPIPPPSGKSVHLIHDLEELNPTPNKKDDEPLTISPLSKPVRDEIEALSDTPLTKDLEKYLAAIEKQAKEQSKKEKRAKREIQAFRVTEAVANGVSQLMQDLTAKRLSKHQQKMADENQKHQQQLQQENRDWVEMQSHRLSISRWFSQEATQNIEDFRKCLHEINKNEEELKKLLSKPLNQQEPHHSQQIQETKRKLSKRKKIASKILKKTGKIFSIGSAILTPINPAIGAGLGAGAALCNGADSVIEDKIVKKELKQQEKNALDQQEKEKHLLQKEQVKHEIALNKEERLALLDFVIADEEFTPPWVKREALEARIKHWDEEIQSLQEAKKGANQDIQKQLLKKNEKAKKKDEALLADEKKYSQISDRAWRVADYWKNVWSPSDKEAKKMASQLAQAIHSYRKATQNERETILHTLSSFEALAAVTGNPNLEWYAKLGQGGYEIFDQSRYFLSTGIPNLKEAWKGPKSMSENLGGWLSICRDYLGPAVSLTLAGIQLYQLSQSNGEGVLAPEEQRFHRLCNRLDDLEYSICNMVDLSSQDVKEQILLCKSAIENAKKEMIETLHQEFEKAHLGEEESAYEKRTFQLEKDILKLEKKMALLKVSPDASEKLLSLLYSEVKNLNSAVQSGMVKPIRGSLTSPPSYSRLVYQNPNLYTGLIASLLNKKAKPLPSLRRYLVLVNAFQILNEKQAELNNPDLVQEMCKELLEKGKQLQSFYESWPKMCKKVVKSHDHILEIGHKKTHKIQLHTQEVLKGRIDQANSNLDELKLTKGSRFGLSSAFVNTNKPRLSIPDVSKEIEKRFSTVKVAATDTGVTATVNAFIFGFIGFCVGGPPGAMGGAAFGGGVSSPLALQDAVSSGETRRGSLYREVIQIKQNSQEKNTQTDYKDASGLVVFHVSSVRKIHKLFVSKVVMKSEYKDLWWTTVYQSKTPSSLLFKLHDRGISVDPSLIDSDDLSKLPLVNWEGKFLTKDHLEKVKTLQGQKEHVMIPPSDPNLIPLSFPQKIVSLFDKETARLNALGYELHPEYVFEYRAAKREYALSLNWQVAEGKVSHGKRATLVLGTFDEDTVRSFGMPIIENNQIVQEKANLNEFLLHAVYGSLLDPEIGLPGNKTTVIKKGSIVAPADLPFEGVFSLLEKNFSQIHFRSDQYDGKASSLYLHGSNMAIEWNKMGSPNCPELEKAYQKYCRVYSGIKGVLTTLFEIAPKRADLLLLSSGLEIPAKGLVRELYEGFPTFSKSENIEKKLKEIDTFAAYSKERKKLLGSIELLKS